MDYQKYLIQAMAAESYFWEKIDKKYDDIGNFGLTKTQKVLNVINELPPKALLRAIKLLAINDAGPDGRDFVADLLQKVFKTEIGYIIDNKENLNFEKYIRAVGEPNVSTNKLLRLVSIYIHVCKIIGLPEDSSQPLIDILTTENELDRNYVISNDAEIMAVDWLKAHADITTLGELSCESSIFTAEFLPLEIITKQENIPMRAFEQYVFTKKDVADMIDIANSFNRPYDLNKFLTTSFLLKSLARYAEECKDAYLDLALSPAVSPTKKFKNELAKKDVEIKALQEQIDKKQQLLNDLQLRLDKQQLVNNDIKEELDNIKDYTDALEKQLRLNNEVVDNNISGVDLSGKVVVMGGHDSWQGKLKERFSNFTFIPTDKSNFDVNLIKNTDWIIFNFTYCSHKQFYRLRGNADKDKIIYTTSTNVEQLEKQLGLN